LKIISKTYVLIAILIIVAVFNLAILYNAQTSTVSDSYSIIKTGDLKANVETIAALASSVARGNESDRKALETKVNEVDVVLKTLKNGGQIDTQNISPIPEKLLSKFEDLEMNWSEYKTNALIIKTKATETKETNNALNYILEKNTDITLGTYSLIRELEVLDRNYIAHQEIAANLHEYAKAIGRNALLVSIGEEKNTYEELRNNRILFDIGMKRLLQLPLDSPEFASYDIDTRPLATIPRENSQLLNELDLIWESVRLRIIILEESLLHADEFEQAFSRLNQQRPELLNTIDMLLDAWNSELIDRRLQIRYVTQSIIGIEVVVFIAVLIIIRKSLTPLERIKNALLRVREGIYGEKINYSSNDEIGILVATFNKMSETIKIKEEEAKKTDIAKDEFLAMITHELKTPLVPIQGYADMLLGGHLGELTDKQKERILIIRSSAASLLQLISDLLDAQKLDLGQLRMKKTTADILQTVNRSIQTMQPQLEEFGIEVTNEVKSCIIPHDTDRIAQVITNLMKNSIASVKPNKGRIKIHSKDDQDSITIMVEDNGIGIPVEKQAKLFTKFYQVDASLTRETRGSGLGLSICKGIVEAHEGSISLQSTPGIGTTVAFTLPKHKAGKTPI
jgi:signal transduction histidine kinase